MPDNTSYVVSFRLPGALYRWLEDHQEDKRDAWRQDHPGQRPATREFTVSQLARHLLTAYQAQQMDHPVRESH